MRILIISTHLNVGGITSYLFALCRQYLKKGHEVYLASNGGSREGEFVTAGVKLIKLPIKIKSEVHPTLVYCLFKLMPVVKKEKIDIIHSHTRVAQVLGKVLSVCTGVPYVSTCHGFYKLRWFRRFFPAWGEGVIAISPAVQEHLVKDFKTKPEKVYQVNNGIDLDHFIPVTDILRQQMRKKFNISMSPIFGIVARLADIKGHTYMIDAMPAILKEFPNALLFFAGEGKMEDELREQTASLGLQKHVIFASVFNPSTAVLPLFDIFVMPSTEEGFGLSGMEAQACALPLVASDVGGIPSFVHHEKTGILVPPKDPQRLADAILDLLKNPGKSRRLSEQGRAFIEREYSAEVTAAKTLRMYDSVIAQHGTRS